MPKPCSIDLRMRLLEAVIVGASRREAAERFEVSASSGVKWLRRWEETGSVAAKPTGGSISALEAHADWLLTLITKQPDLTLDEIVVAMRKRRRSPAAAAQFGGCSHATGSASKKRAYAQPSKNEPTWPAPAGAGCENRVCLIRPGWYLSTRPQPRPTWYGFGAVAGAASD